MADVNDNMQYLCFHEGLNGVSVKSVKTWGCNQCTHLGELYKIEFATKNSSLWQVYMKVMGCCTFDDTTCAVAWNFS